MNNNRPTVSVIIPTYNRAHLLGRAIKSVLNQTYKDFELIVVDDGSTDDTEKVVGNFKDERIRYISLEKNMGAGVARNRGIEASRGKYIAFHDSDDEWLAEKLEKQTGVFNAASSDVGYAYTDMWHVLRDGEKHYWHSPAISKGRIINEKNMDYQVHRLGIQTTMIKKRCFGTIGVFDVRFPRFIDLEFFVRLAKHFNSCHIREPLVKFYDQTDGISSNNRAYSVGRMLLLEKYYDDVRNNRKFVANQYLLISKHSYSYGNVAEGRRYLLKAIATCPFYLRLLSFNFKLLFGEYLHGKLLRCLKGTEKSTGDI